MRGARMKIKPSSIAHCAVDRAVVSKLLRDYVITKNATVKCENRCLAVSFHIHSIIISETFKDSETFGRLAKNAKVEIVEVISKEQLNQLKEFKELDVGGIEEHKRTLSSYLFEKASRKILISGPTGSGKSLFVKKFLSDNKCCLIIIDGLKDINLTMNKCDRYRKQLLQSLKKFPELPSVLLVDHIDEIASSNIKQLKQSCVYALVYLFKSFENSRVSVIVISTEKRNIHPGISRLFVDEVFIGIPSFYQRKEMMIALTKSFPNNEVDLDKVAAMTPGFLARDVTRLVEIASQDTMKTALHEQYSSKAESLSTHHFEKALLAMTPSLLKTSEWNMKVKPVCWNDIGGMDGIKKRLQLCIERPLRHPEMFQKVGLRCPRGVLLFGPPGCCKTTLARGLATECNANFFAASPSQIYSSYVGESEKNISQLFYQARLCAPSIIFLDELDSLVGRRTFETKQHGVAEKILSTLLNEMDGLGVKTTFGDNGSRTLLEDNAEGNAIGKKQLQDEVIVVGATNRPDFIDDALLRPGRFDIILYVPPPNLEERVSILQTITKNMPLNEVDLRKIAEKTKAFTGADLKNVCSMAAKNSLKEQLSNAEVISEHNFIQALEKAEPSVSKKQIQMYEKLSSR
ncbi:hypothetical protein JTE90_017564 [Oedothorax gibbosus]|uniref:AAA+ ATPase domain-containing protein n=1 Tax=Oedothorax gibbosus TaxID=931172 RepID=A0AAV6UPB5_9ARAC|nr:hypothetical protein JTE90_017564 [Oedothorax gibbosus]